MLMKAVLHLLSYLVSSCLVSAHNSIAEDWEWVSQRMPEVVPGLETYDIAHFLDLPLDISTEFFN